MGGLYAMKYFAQIGQFAAKSFSYGLFSQAYTQNRFLAGISFNYFEQQACF